MLNILQACYAAHTTIDEEAIHACTGSPLPSDMNMIMELLLNSDITSAYTRSLFSYTLTAGINKLKTEKGLALVDIIGELFEYIIAIDFPAASKINLLSKISDIEFNMSSGCSEKIQLGGLVSVFKESIDLATVIAV